MISMFIGLATTIGIGYLVVTNANSDYYTYLNLVGIAVVFGGTIAATTLSFNISDVLNTFRVILRVIFTKPSNPQSVVAHFVELATTRQRGGSFTQALQDSNVHPFVKDGLRLIENDFPKDKIIHIMRSAISERRRHHLHEISIVITLAKYPPAFGMIGTVVGLVALLHGLNDADAKSQLGPNMSVALVTTLYGLLIANLMFQPAADKLTHRLQLDQNVRLLILEGILLLHAAEDPVMVHEILSSYLLPANRKEFSAANNAAATSKRAA